MLSASRTLIRFDIQEFDQEEFGTGRILFSAIELRNQSIDPCEGNINLS